MTALKQKLWNVTNERCTPDATMSTICFSSTQEETCNYQFYDGNVLYNDPNLKVLKSLLPLIVFEKESKPKNNDITFSFCAKLLRPFL